MTDFYNNNFQSPTVNVVQSMSYWTFSLYLSLFFYFHRSAVNNFPIKNLCIWLKPDHWNIGKLIFEKQFELKALHQFMCWRSHMRYEVYAMGEYIDTCAVCIVVVFDQMNEMIPFFCRFTLHFGAFQLFCLSNSSQWLRNGHSHKQLHTERRISIVNTTMNQSLAKFSLNWIYFPFSR